MITCEITDLKCHSGKSVICFIKHFIDFKCHVGKSDISILSSNLLTSNVLLVNLSICYVNQFTNLKCHIDPKCHIGKSVKSALSSNLQTTNVILLNLSNLFCKAIYRPQKSYWKYIL
ncbi:G-protein coupled receptor moody [Armadillidium vulgare]|nr:G-protein coupled receptor moody [Armadillidium vulgare]